jgi:hypothetical protein
MKFLRQPSLSMWNVLADVRDLTLSASSRIRLDQYQMVETLSVSCVSMQFIANSSATDTVCIISDSFTSVPDDGDIVSFRNVENHFCFNTSDS